MSATLNSSAATRPGALAALARKPRSAVALVKRIVEEKRRQRAIRGFLDEAATLFDEVERPERPSAVVAFADNGFVREAGLYALVGRRLAQLGAAPLYLGSRFRLRPYRDPELAAIEGVLERESRTLTRHRDRQGGALLNRWDIDLRRGVFAAAGIDFFPALLGMLRRDFRVYDVDLEAPAVAAEIAELIVSADAALAAALALEALAQRHGLPVRVLAAELSYVPGGIFNLFCRDRGHASGMEFVDFGEAYAHYFATDAKPSTTFAALNLTRHGVHTRMSPSPTRFKAWLAAGQDGEAALARVRPAVLQNRTRTQPPPAAEQLLRRVDEHRARGGKVACLFGHLGFDLGGFHDDGPAHRDMIDWLNDSIATLAGTDVMLLVKPHIAEVRHKANHRPNQLLRDLIRVPIPDNVVLLDPLWFNAHALFGHIDAGLVWRSSVALELMIAGIPAIVCCREAYYWPHLDLLHPNDRADYHRLLRRIGDLTAGADRARAAALLLRHIAEETFIELPYIERPVPRMPVRWRRDILARLRAGGDARIDRVCAEILAPATPPARAD